MSSPYALPCAVANCAVADRSSCIYPQQLITAQANNMTKGRNVQRGNIEGAVASVCSMHGNSGSWIRQANRASLGPDICRHNASLWVLARRVGYDAAKMWSTSMTVRLCIVEPATRNPQNNSSHKSEDQTAKPFQNAYNKTIVQFYHNSQLACTIHGFLTGKIRSY